MPNPVLTRLMDERASQVEFIDTLLGRVESETRDLVDAERSNLTSARERIAAIDAQREPLEAFENLRDVSAESTRLAYAGAQRAAHGEQREPERGRALGMPTAPDYASAGHFLVDYVRAVGYPGQQITPDPEAQQRVALSLGRAIDKQTTTETPGLLPKPIIGAVMSDMDGARPFVQSIGARDMSGVPGKTFSRPYVTQHTLVGPQAGGEKTQLPSRALKVGSLDFTKQTYGGVVNISRQDIDWTSPSAWDALLADLQAVYAAETDDVAAAALATAVTQSVTADTADLPGMVAALYAAAALAVTGDGTQRASALRLPNHIWQAVDTWATLGAAISVARSTTLTPTGNASPDTLTGDILGLPRTIVPGLPAGTIIVGRTNRTEFYEERIGVLSAVEPGILGVEVAYGGYAAFGTPDPSAFAKIVLPGG